MLHIHMRKSRIDTRLLISWTIYQGGTMHLSHFIRLQISFGHLIESDRALYEVLAPLISMGLFHRCDNPGPISLQWQSWIIFSSVTVLVNLSSVTGLDHFLLSKSPAGCSVFSDGQPIVRFPGQVPGTVPAVCYAINPAVPCLARRQPLLSCCQPGSSCSPASKILHIDGRRSLFR